MRRKKRNAWKIVIAILLILLGVVIVYACKDKLFSTEEPKTTNNTQKVDNSTSDKKNTNTDNNTNKVDNSNDMSTSEPKKNETSETKQQLQNNVTVTIELIGSEDITLNVGDKYNELGVKAIDSNGKDVSKEVTIQNNVDTSKKGEYMVIYSIGKSIVIRNVTVK